MSLRLRQAHRCSSQGRQTFGTPQFTSANMPTPDERSFIDQNE
jgi:hypothetical protein